MQTLVSVVMSVHNGGRYLKEAIGSILDQTFPNFEFIIVDDGSTDHTRTILEEYGLKDARIRWISRGNQGLTKSLNEGLALARGGFIARMDADDVSMPGRFEAQVRFLGAHPEYAIVGAEVLMIDSDGDPLCPRGHLRDNEAIDRQCLLGDGGAMTHPVVMIRKSALDAIGGYDPTFATAQDLDLYLRLCEVGRAYNLPETLLHWRLHSLSVNRRRCNTWAQTKAQAVGGAIRRRGVEACLQRVFSEDANFMAGSFDEQCFAMAKLGGNYRCALKHLRRAVSERGANAGDLRRLATVLLAPAARLVRSCLGK